MPCNDYNDYVQPCGELKDKIDKLTQFLCYMCGTAAINEQKLPQPIQDWWEDHFSHDTDRVLKEMREAIIIRTQRGVRLHAKLCKTP